MSDLEEQLESALAEAGRIIEEIPWDQRHERCADVLTKLGYLDPDAPTNGASEFIIGCLVHAHQREIYRQQVNEFIQKEAPCPQT